MHPSMFGGEHPGPGDVVAGKYRVESVLGKGGMGVVVSAVHQLFGERVAIKFLLPQAMHGVGLERFLREAKVAFQLKSQHVVRVLDVAQLESGAPYIVMEQLAGEDLAALVTREGPLPVAVAIDYVLEACEALAEAHSKGIVHRDLKPSNLFLAEGADGERTVKVLDFGISKLVSQREEDQALTGSRAVMGSPLYMSPEQVMSARDVGAATDVWALGVILYELLTARTPFNGESFGALTVAIVTQPATTPRAFRPDLPEELERVVLGCLAKAPPQRPASVAELARLLEPFAGPQSRRLVDRISRLAGQRGGRASALPEQAPAAAAPTTREPGSTLPSPAAAASAEAGTFSPVSDDGVVLPIPRWSLGRRIALGVVALAGSGALAAGWALGNRSRGGRGVSSRTRK